MVDGFGHHLGRVPIRRLLLAARDQFETIGFKKIHEHVRGFPCAVGAILGKRVKYPSDLLHKRVA